MVARWTHITLTVSNLERTIDFYRSFCNLTVVRDRRLEGASTVWLGPEPAPGEQPTFLLVITQGEVPYRMDHLGFQCDSRQQVDRMAALGKELGILVYPPRDSGGSMGYWTMLQDPDGNRVEFTYGQPVKGLEEATAALTEPMERHQPSMARPQMAL